MLFRSFETAKKSSGLLNSQERFRFLPKRFEIVELAPFRRKDMHDDIAQIDQHPSAAADALKLAVKLEFIADFILNGVGERLDHAVGGGADDDEIVGKVDLFGDVEKKDIFAFMFFEDFDDALGNGCAVVFLPKP